MDAEGVNVRTSAAHLHRALDDLSLIRGRIRGLDIFPQAEIVRIWPVIVPLYTILEGAMKLLAELSELGYLTKCTKKKGRRWMTKAKAANHNLSQVFDDVDPVLQDAMQENYAQLISLVKCGVGRQAEDADDELAGYLKMLDGIGLDGEAHGSILWRYVLLEQNIYGEKPPVLPHANADIMREIARHALRLAMRVKLDDLSRGMLESGKGVLAQDAFLENVERKAWKSADVSSMELPEDESLDDMRFADWRKWVKDSEGFLNAVLKQASVGPMLRHAKPAVSDRAERVMRSVRRSASEEATRNPDLEFLFDCASARRIMVDWHRRRFVHGPARPPSVQASIHEWHDKWTAAWAVIGRETWRGAWLVDVVSGVFRIPDRKHQQLCASWRDADQADRPRQDDIQEGQVGVLTLLYGGAEVARMDAIALLVQCGGTGGIVTYGDEFCGSSGEDGDRVAEAVFLRIDLADGWASMDGDTPVNSAGQSAYKCMSEAAVPFECIECQGTGFCSECLGHPADAGTCGACGKGEPSLGLCSACAGHGCVGDMWIARLQHQPSQDR